MKSVFVRDVMKKIIHLLLSICLLTANLGYAWNWPWDSNATIYNNMTSLEKVQAYQNEVIEPLIRFQIKLDEERIRKADKRFGDLSIPVDVNEPLKRQCLHQACFDAYSDLQLDLQARDFYQKHGQDAMLGLIEWPDFVIREVARDNLLKQEAAFKLKYELTNKQFAELEEQLKQEYPGLERKKETRAFFSPIESEQPSLLSKAENKWQDFQKEVSTTWRTTTPATFANPKFSGGSGFLDKLKQWWQSKSDQYSIRQSLNNKAVQIKEQYKQSTPSTFGEAKFRGSGQLFQKLRESWQNRAR